MIPPSFGLGPKGGGIVRRTLSPPRFYSSPSADGPPMKLPPWKTHKSRRGKDFRGQRVWSGGFLRDPVEPRIEI